MNRPGANSCAVFMVVSCGVRDARERLPERAQQVAQVLHTVLRVGDLALDAQALRELLRALGPPLTPVTP